MCPRQGNDRGVSAERDTGPWGTVLVLLAILAVANAVVEPFARDGEHTAADLTGDATQDPMVRKTKGWASVRRATITPGIQTITGGTGQCTTNFVFTDARGQVYLGQAAHCARTDEDLNGCRAETLPLGTRVSFVIGATLFDEGRRLGRGRLVYSSWRTMQARHVSNPDLCAFNDFALVKVAREHHGRVNPTLPYWGGPTGLSKAAVRVGDSVYGYGRSSLRPEKSRLSRQAATAMTDSVGDQGWSHTITSASPGLPGDSGSAYVDQDGRAVGTLSTLRLGPLLVWNGLSDLSRELAYARRHSGIEGLRLELGTEPFRDSVRD